MDAGRRNFLVVSTSGIFGWVTQRIAFSQGRGRRGGHGGGRGHGGDANHRADQELIHTLLANREQIRRQVKNLPNGVETLTETDDPQLRATLVKHVESMYRRVEGGRPIHRRDPLFAEIFRNASKISMELEPTDLGLRVVETSEDPSVVKLIQSHAQVVSLFIENGHREVRKNHAVPR